MVFWDDENFVSWTCEQIEIKNYSPSLIIIILNTLMSMTIVDNQICQDPPTKRKIELCKSWTEEGYCRYGESCFFAHGIDELIRYQPALRKKICRNFHQHKYCKFGSRCNFVHEVKEVPEITKSKSFQKMMEEFPELIPQMRFRKSLLQFL